jgi:hypothetical protein
MVCLSGGKDSYGLLDNACLALHGKIARRASSLVAVNQPRNPAGLRASSA